MNVLRALACAVLAAYTTQGWALIADLDTSFSGDGIGHYNSGYDYEVPNDIYVAPSGLTYVLGRAYDYEGGVGADDNRIVVMRLKANGALDTSFASGGKFIISEALILANNFVPYALLADEASQRIYFAGAHIGVADGNSSRLAVARTTFAGVYDDSFGSDGVAYIDAPSSAGTYAYDNYAYELALESDGSVVAMGVRSHIQNGAKVAVARFSSNGTPDISFGGENSYNGFLVVDFGQKEEYPRGLEVMADGKLIFNAASGVDFQHALVVGRLTSAGEFDASFSTDGWRTDDLGGTLFSALGPRVGADGQITIVGMSTVDGDERNFIVRYTSTGDRDGTFGTGGLTEEATTVYYLNGTLALHPAGKIVSAWNTSSNATGYDITVARLIGSSALALPGYVEPSESSGGGTLPLSLTWLFGLAALVRARRREK